MQLTHFTQALLIGAWRPLYSLGRLPTQLIGKVGSVLSAKYSFKNVMATLHRFVQIKPA